MKKITAQIIFLLFICCNMLFGQASLTKGLVGYYKMDEGTDEVLVNSATGTDVMPDGIIYNPVWSDTAVTGTALYFDIPANLPDEIPSYVDFGTYDPAQGGGKFSFSCWYSWNGPNGEYQGITGKRTDWTNELVYWDVCFKRTGPIQFEAVGAGEVKQLLLSDSVPAINKYQNLTVTYGGNEAKMYLDGQLIKQGIMELGLKKDAAFMLGCCEPLGVTPFTGNLDEVRYYNRVLSITEVNSLYEYPVKNLGSDKLLNNTLQVFPNPASDELKIKGENLNLVKIMDISGKVVLEQKVSGNLIRMNISGLKPGIYFVNANGTENMFCKVIKK
jgi:hypothetical protein